MLRHAIGMLVLGAALVLGLASRGPTAAQAPDPKPQTRIPKPLSEEALAARIDRLLGERQKAAGVAPAPLADDSEFLRRVWLDLAGRIPTLGEARAFPDDRAPDKRARLVRKLLDSPAHVDHFVNVWRDLLIPEAPNNQDVQGQLAGFTGWLRKQVSGNVPYDKTVRELLTVPFGSERVRPRMAREPQPADPQAATPLAFYLAKDAKPENLAASTARLFLGVRIECAQCHNHPTASWTREHFWGYAAFFAGLQRTSPDAGGAIREVFDRRDIKIPGGKASAEARFLDESEPQWRYNVGARTTLADWVTAPGNPYFAPAAVNRLWALLFGVGLVEPVDDFRPDNPPSHPELLDELAAQFVAHRFDLRYLLRAITASRAYQLTSAAPPAKGGATAPARLFTHMALKGLTAEQLFDSLAVATGYKEPAGPPPGNGQPAPAGARAEFLARFATAGQSPTEAQRSIQQALTLMNGRFIADATGAQNATLKGVLNDAGLDTAGRVEALFLATLSRKPTEAEARRFVTYVETCKDGKRALGDVFWALLNSAEFSLNH
jgi:hypothetical protein